MMRLSECSSKQIMRVSDFVHENYSEPERSEMHEILREAYAKARLREQAERQRIEGQAQVKRIRALYDRPSVIRASSGRTECHVCDGRGEHPGLPGRRRCGHCFGKGYI